MNFQCVTGVLCSHETPVLLDGRLRARPLDAERSSRFVSASERSDGADTKGLRSESGQASSRARQVTPNGAHRMEHAERQTLDNPLDHCTGWGARGNALGRPTEHRRPTRRPPARAMAKRRRGGAETPRATNVERETEGRRARPPARHSATKAEGRRLRARSTRSG